MSEVAEQSLSKDDVWKAHVLKAQASRLSDAKYCLKNELSLWIFTTYKKRLGFVKPRVPKPTPAPSAFARVVMPMAAPSAQSEPPRAVRTAHSDLPDAAWCADFVRALLAAKK